MKRVSFVLVAAALLAQAGRAALLPLAPLGDKPVPLVPELQQQVMNLPTLEARMQFLSSSSETGKKARRADCWRKAVPFQISIQPTAGEIGPWTVRIGKKADLSDAQVWYLATERAKRVKGESNRVYAASSGKPVVLTIPYANLEVATRYYWQVSSPGCCKKCSPGHKCAERKATFETPVTSFKTEDFAPRWIAIEGRVANMRDLGGRPGLGGKRVRQGMVYRGQGLNDNSTGGGKHGRNRLMVEDVKYMTGTLGIKTDLDLRTSFETADLAESPLGPTVKFIHNSSSAYLAIDGKIGKKAMAVNFRVFANPANYPIYFHCIGGADRTGALAYVLNGILGVSKQQLETDWESTFYPCVPDENPDANSWCRESHFNTVFGRYGKEGDSICTRLELYLKSCGITDEEIEKFREIMLEK